MQEENYLLLIHKFLTKRITPEEQDQLDNWLSQGMQNRQTFEEVKAMWEMSEGYQNKVNYNAKEELQKLQTRIKTASVIQTKQPRKVWIRYLFIVSSIAASLLIILGLIYLFQVFSDAPSASQMIIYQQENTSIHLPDNSRVQLNKNSEITFDPNFKERRIALRGEAFFEVQPNPEKPFLIDVSDVTIRVLGTSFNVQAYDEEKEIEVTVVSGSVEVYNNADTLTIKTGEKASIDKVSQSITLSFNDNPNFLAWKTNQLVFDDVRLQEVLSLLKEQYDVSFNIKSHKLLDCRFTGTFQKDQLHKVLEVLSFSLNFSYHYQNGQYILSGKGCE